MRGWFDGISPGGLNVEPGVGLADGAGDEADGAGLRGAEVGVRTGNGEDVAAAVGTGLGDETALDGAGAGDAVETAFGFGLASATDADPHAVTQHITIIATQKKMGDRKRSCIHDLLARSDTIL